MKFRAFRVGGGVPTHLAKELKLGGGLGFRASLGFFFLSPFLRLPLLLDIHKADTARGTKAPASLKSRGLGLRV